MTRRAEPPKPQETDAERKARQLEARLAVEAWLREVNPEPTPEELEAIEREWQG